MSEAATGADFCIWAHMNVKSIAPRERIDCSDVPFLPPLDVVIDLPFPPSVNRIWRGVRRDNGKAVMLSPEYRKWKDAADALALLRRACRDGNRVAGPFEATILLNMEIGRIGDLDNRAKAVLDWLQSRCVVQNDSLCRRLVMEWVINEAAPDGCRVTVRGVSA